MRSSFKQTLHSRRLAAGLSVSVSPSSLLRFVPGGVQQALLRGRSSTAIASLRRASILFINLPGIKYNQNPQFLLETVQLALSKLQLVLYSLEGMLRQFIVDDKGTTCICVFGIFLRMKMIRRWPLYVRCRWFGT